MLKDVMTELSFMIIFASSFPLLDIDVSIEAQKTISFVIIGSIVTILAVEVVAILFGYVGMMCQIYQMIKEKIQERKNGKTEKDSGSGTSN